MYRCVIAKVDVNLNVHVIVNGNIDVGANVIAIVNKDVGEHIYIYSWGALAPQSVWRPCLMCPTGDQWAGPSWASRASGGRRAARRQPRTRRAWSTTWWRCPQACNGNNSLRGRALSTYTLSSSARRGPIVLSKATSNTVLKTRTQGQPGL